MNKGLDVFISPNAYIKHLGTFRIGDHSAIDHGFYCTVTATVGAYVHVGPYVTAIGGVDSTLHLEDFATVAAGARLICKGEEHHGAGLIGPRIPPEFRDKLIGGHLHIERYANVLTNAVLLPGSKIGEGAIIAAGAVFGGIAQPWSVYAGVPARKVGERESERMLRNGKLLLGTDNAEP